MHRAWPGAPADDPPRVPAITDPHDTPAAQLARLVQFVHPERVFGWLPGLDEARLAGLYGLELEAFRALRDQFESHAREAARMLLADPVFAARVDRLPFVRGSLVVGLGDGATADRQSWLAILRHLLAERRARDDIRVVEWGVSGATTTDVLCRLGLMCADRPGWLVCCLGTADAVRYGSRAAKPAVSPEETARNLAEIRRASLEAATRCVWITPPPIDEAAAAAFRPFRMLGLTLRNRDLEVVADAIRALPDPVVDLRHALGEAAAEGLVLEDGVHPSLTGHSAIAKALVERLSP